VALKRRTAGGGRARGRGRGAALAVAGALVLVLRAMVRSSLVHWVLLAAAFWIAGGVAVRGLRRDPRFLADPAFRAARGEGPGGAPVITPALDRLRALGPINLFDPTLDARVRTALDEIPNVAAVTEVRRLWPSRYAVRLRLHRPVAVVVRGEASIPVTAGGVALPAAPYCDVTPRLPRIRGVRSAPPALGERWPDAGLADGLATIAQLGPHVRELATLRLTEVDVSQAHDARAGVVVLGAAGLRVRWGRPRRTVGENSVERKLAYLRVVADYPEQVRGREIDIRWSEPYFSPGPPAEQP
jgi:hypothetical protein